MTYVIEREPPAVIPVRGSEGGFPVNNIYCVGRNYADHALEMGGDPGREPPFFFMKPSFAVLAGGGDMIYPSLSADVHHEVELVVALGVGGQDIATENAMSHVFGYAVGLDMTRRDLQAEAKEKSRPWEAGKTFVHAAPCGDLARLSDCGELNQGDIELAVNRETRQAGNLDQMIWRVPEIISRLSALFLLSAGDLVFTGTPAGVGQIQPGDVIDARIESLPGLSFKVSSS